MVRRAFSPTDEDREIATRLRSRRARLNIKQGEFAARIGISPRTLNRYELCQRAIPRHELRRMEDLLGPLQPARPGDGREKTPAWALERGESYTETLNGREWLLIEGWRYMGAAQRERLFQLMINLVGYDLLRDAALREGKRLRPYKAKSMRWPAGPLKGDEGRPPWDTLVPGTGADAPQKAPRRNERSKHK